MLRLCRYSWMNDFLLSLNIRSLGFYFAGFIFLQGGAELHAQSVDLYKTDFLELSPEYTNDIEIELQDLLNKADLYIQQDQYEQALQVLSQADDLAASMTGIDISKKILNSMANIYYSTGQLKQAQRYYNELVNQDEQDGSRGYLAVSLFNLGHVFASQEKYLEADEKFERSLQISQELEDESGIAFALKALGVNAQAQNNRQLAEEHLIKALSGFRKIDDQQQIAAIHRHLGDNALEDKNYVTAVEYYEKALPLLAEQTSNSALLRTYRGLSDAYEALQEYGPALISHRAYTQLWQLQQQQSSTETAQRLQVQFETQRYSDENERLELQSQRQQIELQLRNDALRMQYIVSGLTTGIILLLGLLWWHTRQHAQKMQKLATIDGLTGLLNRRAIMQFGVKEWQRSTRFKHPFSCLIFDIDNFKKVNDTFGHSVGDEVLKFISSVVKSTLRETDALGRFGGEEFLLLATETDPSQAEILAERIREKIEQTSHQSLGDTNVTVSIGVAQKNGEFSLDELINHADEALYSAKNNGRNRVAVYQ